MLSQPSDFSCATLGLRLLIEKVPQSFQKILLHRVQYFFLLEKLGPKQFYLKQVGIFLKGCSSSGSGKKSRSADEGITSLSRKVQSPCFDRARPSRRGMDVGSLRTPFLPPLCFVTNFMMSGWT
mmetsp:Transcript_42399/g.78431  ORF Transcript_42399/g.78431 Transcript_42399/m.78431 type:complete len:124 (-) Transcript_42399:250-621(-)